MRKLLLAILIATTIISCSKKSDAVVDTANNTTNPNDIYVWTEAIIQGKATVVNNKPASFYKCYMHFPDSLAPVLSSDFKSAAYMEHQPVSNPAIPYSLHIFDFKTLKYNPNGYDSVNVIIPDSLFPITYRWHFDYNGKHVFTSYKTLSK